MLIAGVVAVLFQIALKAQPHEETHRYDIGEIAAWLREHTADG